MHRKSMLVFGPEGVGKSRLLQAFVGKHPVALYIPQMRTPREFLLALLKALHAADEAIGYLEPCRALHILIEGRRAPGA